ncbi:MAG: hypothetical protein IJ017_04625 [Oscillospiraceae bacterium]|nr:hypothetical protein [Oscillospiraceae bacterium]
MKVTSKAVVDGFADYLSKELKPQYPTNTLGGFMMGFSSGLIRRRAEIVAAKLMSNPLISTFVIDEEGMIDLDELLEAAREAVPDTGLIVSIPLSGEVTFRKSDADVIKQYIERASG